MVQKLTPAMEQYMQMKNKHPDCLIMFRMGDFYEMFFNDAKLASKELEITLTARGKGETRVPLAGIPYHALQPYLSKLVKKGYKVAICEQMEDPKLAKGVVKRDIVRIVTPGTVVESHMLDEKDNNFLMSLFKEKENFGIALADLSTGEFFTTKVNSFDKLLNEISRFNPAECIIPLAMEKSDIAKKIKEQKLFLNYYDDMYFWNQKAYSTLTEQFDTISLDGFGLQQTDLSVNAAGALLSYLKETQKSELSHINKIHHFSTEDFMLLDSSTQRNLELTRNVVDNSNRGTLLSILDTTITPMGSRLLKSWVKKPLLDIEEIKKRSSAVGEFCGNIFLRQDMISLLDRLYDIERLISKVTYGNSNARDLVALKKSLLEIPKLKELLKDVKTDMLKHLSSIDTLPHITSLIEKAILDDPSALLKEGNMIKYGYDEQLDKLQDITKNGKKWIADLEQKEREKTGIKSLKIRFNKVFGYFLEVTKANIDLVPSNYIRKQTQVNAERYITDELKEYESNILGAEEKITALEYKLFNEINAEIAKETKNIQKAARNIACLDVLCSLADTAVKNNYVKPIVDDSDDLTIEDGRHPVIEKMQDSFVPNDTDLNDNDNFMIITGPNMAGKSTYMRQVAMVVLMAQIGSFVPAKHAKLGIVDRIFTRIGAYDDLSSGQSTFMIEMNETANILNNATSKSLVILDEIGRGTSTFDGISIACAVAEYIHNTISSKTLFATHYHQLNNLSKKLKGVKNYNIAVTEENDKITFLRKIIEGGTDKSYGVQVARLAGLPKEVIERSKMIMNQLEMEDEISFRLHNNLKNGTTKKKEVKKDEVPVKFKQVSLLDV